MGAAGMGDRAWVLAHLLPMAKMLCAVLHVEPPCEILSAGHNLGAKLNCTTATWERYWNISNLNIATTPAWLHEFRASHAGLPEFGGQGENLEAQYRRAASTAVQRRSFLWRFDHWFYSGEFQSLWRSSIQPRMAQCRVPSPQWWGASDLARELASKFLRKHGLQNLP